MKKRILCLFLCLSLLAVFVPAGTFSITTSAAGSSYLVDTFNGLKSMFSYNTSETEPLYLKLENDISKTITEPTELATAGRDVVLDLGGYTLSFTDKGSDPSTPINGKNGSITIMDSKRYDESTGKWVSGKIEYLYTQPERGTEVMTGDIIVKGGKIVNKTHDGAFPINYNSAYTSSTASGYIKMYGGTLEADYPIFLQYVKGSVIYGGTLNIKWNAGILIWKYNYTSVFSAEELPKVYNVKMFNCSTDATVHAFETSATSDYLKLYTMEHALQTLGSSMFGEGAEAYIDGIRYEDVTKKFELGGSPSYEISGPYFKSHYEVFIPETVDKIELTIPEPEPGELMPYDAYEPADSGYSVVNDYITGNSGYRNGVQWTSGYTYTDIYDFGSSFEAGKSYAAFIMVVPVKPKYSFADVDKISATINGKKALVYENNGTYIVYRTFDVNKKTVDNIEIKVTEPKAGVLPSYAATIPEDTGYAIQTSSFTNGVSWMNESGAALASGYKFEKDKKYSVLVMLKLTDSQKYQFEDSTKINATINGKKATVIPYSPTSYGITYQFDLSTTIGNIELTVPNIKAGGKAEWSASVPENADYIVENKTAYLTANGITWYNEEGKTVTPGKNLTFEAGKTYKVTVSVEAADKDNYKFAAEGNVTAKVNGKAAEVHVTSDTKCLVIYTFTANKVIDNVELTIAEPKAGEKLSYVALVPDGVDYEIYPFTSDPSVNLWKDGVAWLRNGSEQLNPGQTALAGQKYLVYIKLRSKDKVNAPFDAASNITATINGKTAKVLRHSDNTYHVYYTFTALSDEATIINSVNITVPEPKEGDQITYNAAVPEGNGYTVDPKTTGNFKNGIYWIGPEGVLEPEKTYEFKAGKEYTVNVYLKVTDITKYQFASEGELFATINGNKASVSVLSDGSYRFYYTFKILNAYKRGDINGDGKVDATDAIILKKHMLNITILNEESAQRADLDSSGKIDTTDYIILKRILLGIEK